MGGRDECYPDEIRDIWTVGLNMAEVLIVRSLDFQ